MILRWGNGSLIIGPLIIEDAWGIDLAWGRRDLLGDPPDEGERIYADRVRLIVATGREVYLHGSVWRAALARVLSRLGRHG